MRHRTAFRFTLVAIAFLFLPRQPSLACTCGSTPTIAQALAASQSAFIATARNVALDYSKHQRITTFEVLRVFKGLVSPSIRVMSNLDEAACGYSFARDATYLVFTNTISGRAFTSLCGGNRALIPAQPYPPELGTGSAPLVLAP